MGQWPVHCLQHQGSAQGWGLQTSTAFMEKSCLHGKKSRLVVPALRPRQGVSEQSQLKGWEERGLAQKGPHPAARASGNADRCESSQLLSSGAEAAAHRSRQLEEGQGLRRVFSLGWWTDSSDRQQPASSSIPQTTAQPLCSQGFKWGHRVLVAAPIQKLQPSFPPSSLPEEGGNTLCQACGPEQDKGVKGQHTFLEESEEHSEG